MAQLSTERACDRCRERRVKCDKAQPTCLRCEKLGKPCPGYDKKRKFVDEGESLRRKYPTSNDPREGGDDASEHGLESGTAAGAVSFTSNPRLRENGNDFPSRPVTTTFVPEYILPRQAQSRGIAQTIESKPVAMTSVLEAQPIIPQLPLMEPVPEQLMPFPETNYALQDFQADYSLDSVMNDTTYDPAWFNLEPISFYGNNDNSCGFIPNAHIIDEVDRNDMWQTTEAPANTPRSGFGSSTVSHLWAPESQLSTSAMITDEREHEMAYLIRHFTESIGPWMDLFDKDKHFAHLVPLKALRDALLRNAIAAVAAKQLGRVKGHKLFGANQCQKPAMMETIDSASEVDWFYKAANYYDKAIACSRTYLAALSGDSNNPSSPRVPSSPSMGNSDDLLAAVSIFSLYESLDDMELGMMGWFQHLTGLKTLLTAVSVKQQEQSQMMPSITVGRQASFWNFARADWQAAYYNKQKTLLDTEDVRLWRSCGLHLPVGGSLYADPVSIKNDPLHCREIAQLVTHTILWLVLRVTNYLANNSEQTGPVRQAIWDQLTTQLEIWYGNLPETFRPCAQIRYPLQMRSRRSGTTQLTEVFFSIHQCAAAIQLYHFACILLLLNKPSDGMAVTSRLKAYREVSAEATKHARAVVGIALGRPHPAVRVEMTLPLYVAGGCLEADEERKVVLELLRAIEQDTGVSTEGKVRSLIDEWGWTQEAEGIV